MSQGDVKHIVIVGDGSTGKTCILYTYINKKFNDEYIPTIYDKEEISITVDSKAYDIQLHDTAGQEDFDRLRKVIYKQADAFILCYAVDNTESYNNCSQKWIPELRASQPNAAIVLVGTKIDLRNEVGGQYISAIAGETLKNKIKAQRFVECSAKSFINIDRVIEEAVRATDDQAYDSSEDGSGDELCCCARFMCCK